MSLQEYYSHNSNVVCDDFCATKPPLNNHALLLGLGGKFCTQPIRISLKKLQDTIERFRCDVRVKNYTFNHVSINDEPPLKFYFKTKSSNIPKVSPVKEGAVSHFKKALLASYHLRNKKSGTDIAKMQENVLFYFNNHPEYVILLVNKNLGPFAMNRSEHVQQVLQQYLSDKFTLINILNLIKDSSCTLPTILKTHLERKHNNSALKSVAWCLGTSWICNS